ncbi:MAG TPA: peptidoglycan DD-metalloendopeptidase family protein [Vicinamibacterales bacterium]|nr:peptidoglycan DD-metalloendopeptidase family protein [Vicinamibacterales bacterium]
MFLLCAVAGPGAFTGEPRGPSAAQDESVTKRIADRLAALQREADALASREKSLLNDLRGLEIERQMKTEQLAAIEQDVKATQQQLAEANARAAALRDAADAQQPEVQERLVRLYKMGRAGYWRLLLDVDDVQSMGRAYRTASALTRLDRDRVQQHRQTLAALERERRELERRAARLSGLQSRSAAARAALDRAVASRAALVKSIESRRDLTAQLAAELDAAHLRLQSTLAQNPGATASVPLRPFRGAIPWPADGIVVSRFGRQRSARMAGIDFTRNGVELSLPEGRPVAAVHEGVVTHAGPFSGFGHLVILDHGGGAVTLYGHLASLSVNKGDRLAAGSRVGLSGRNTSGNPSLYFELRIDGKPVDPLQWLRRQP